MTKKTRLIIFLSCIVCFVVIAPILVAYSLGYKFDFVGLKVVTTGGIYVRTFPAADKISVDSNAPDKPGLFSNSVFIQGLLPKDHTLSIEKLGYYPYQKTVLVEGKEVTKVENVLLIKKNILFSLVSNNVDYFSIANNNQNVLTLNNNANSISFTYFSLSNNTNPTTFSITGTSKSSDIKWSDDSRFALIKTVGSLGTAYYIFDASASKASARKLAYLDANSSEIIFNPQNSNQLFYLDGGNIYSYNNVTLSIDPKVTLIIKGVKSYTIINNGFVWLSEQGILNQSDFFGSLQTQLSDESINATAQNYSIFSADSSIFLQKDNNLFVLDKDNIFEKFLSPENFDRTIISPDGKHMIYVGQKNISLYSFDNLPAKTSKKYAQIYSGENITNAYWLNNDYIIFADQDNVIISEIDYRGNINTITLPTPVVVQDESNTQINISSPEIFYNRQDNKLYILSENTFISSEKLVP